MKNIILSFLMILGTASMLAQGVRTERKYLSGHGCDDMVQWDFYCTDGANSGEWTKIGVPSCWELQGFGTYQYGMKFYGKETPEGIADEEGKYRYEFTLPQEWEGRQIELVFEAAMTECVVYINGRKAGNAHQGGFSPFRLDVSDRIFCGKKVNRLEVTVSKESTTNTKTNLAERRADYWNFGGLIRPVYVESRPANSIQRVAINAEMDGNFKAEVYLNHAMTDAKLVTSILAENGKTVASGETAIRSDVAYVDIKAAHVKTWTAETPVRYTARFVLQDGTGKVLHEECQKFGFRTVQLREHDGLYVNGQRINVRGVNRHSFRPESGRTLSYQKNLEDVQLIKSMNMNACRLSHYPADPEFLDICDSLGLYVMEELSGWHWAHDTMNGKKLVKEMVTRDVNHPSILWWSNGNEGGFNYELESTFYEYDPQHRTIIYPWSNRNGYETRHYRSYGESQDYMRKPEPFMPTEFLHGLYDGGHGAGLYDYWKMMYAHPRCVGGFLWSLADEGVVRVDRGGMIDNVGNYAADGIVGPHHEKEGSYYTIRQLWCPVYVDSDQKGSLTGLTASEGQAGGYCLSIENRYDFLNLNTVTFQYEYLSLSNGKVPRKEDIKVLKKGSIKGPDVAPHSHGEVHIPGGGNDAELLRITATDLYGQELMQWSKSLRELSVSQKVDDFVAHIDPKTGLLDGVEVKGKHISLMGGPRFVAARRSDRSLDQFYNHDDKQAEKKKTLYSTFQDQGVFEELYKRSENCFVARYRYGCMDSVEYTIMPEQGAVLVNAHYNFQGVVDLMGVMFDYPEEMVLSKSWIGNGPYRVWQNRMHGPQYGFWENSYNDPVPGESFEYPEFKGYFSSVHWMNLRTKEGNISIVNLNPEQDCVGIYEPRDGRDQTLYALPKTGISLMRVIPAVRNKVNCTDLNGPSAQPYWANGVFEAKFYLQFDASN